MDTFIKLLSYVSVLILTVMFVGIPELRREVLSPFVDSSESIPWGMYAFLSLVPLSLLGQALHLAYLKTRKIR